jgi:hypothetical protein
MKTIWKFTLAAVDEQEVMMPLGAEVLAVQEQHGTAQAWAIVDPEQKALRPVHFSLRGTGNPLRVVGRYVGTFQLKGGSLVFHAFVAYPETRTT